MSLSEGTLTDGGPRTVSVTVTVLGGPGLSHGEGATRYTYEPSLSVKYLRTLSCCGSRESAAAAAAPKPLLPPGAVPLGSALPKPWDRQERSTDSRVRWRGETRDKGEAPCEGARDVLLIEPQRRHREGQGLLPWPCLCYNCRLLSAQGASPARYVPNSCPSPSGKLVLIGLDRPQLRTNPLQPATATAGGGNKLLRAHRKVPGSRKGPGGKPQEVNEQESAGFAGNNW